MSVVSLAILPVNVDNVVVQEDVVAAALDTAGVQVMVEGISLILMVYIAFLICLYSGF